MIDENLCRAELSPSERARQTARRKAIYEELNPETKVGGAPAKAIGGRASAVAQGKDVANANLADASFTADTAAKTGQSERVVQRDAERGDKIIDEVANSYPRHQARYRRLPSGSPLSSPCDKGRPRETSQCPDHAEKRRSSE